MASALQRVASVADRTSRLGVLAEEIRRLTGAETVAISLTDDADAPENQTFVAVAPTGATARQLWHAEVYARTCAGLETRTVPGGEVGSPYAHWLGLPMVSGPGPARGLVHLHGQHPFPADVVAVARVLSLHATVVAGELHAQDALDAALAEVEHRDSLVHEAHHRITNNIASVAALLQMQARAQGSPEVQSELLEAVSRVQTFGRIHESLYRSGTATDIAVGEHLRGLLAEVAATAWNADDCLPQVTVSCPPEVRLTPAVATPLSLIAVELVMNAVKHAIVPTPPLRINVTLKNQDALILTVADNGPGFARLPRDRGHSFGLTLVNTLAVQLGGSMTVGRAMGGEGATVTIRLPAPA